MGNFLHFIGIRPFKFLRFCTTFSILVGFLIAVTILSYFISSSAQYGMQLSNAFGQTRKINFKKCNSQECINEIISNNRFSDLVSVSSLITKLDKYYENQKNILKEEYAIERLNESINSTLEFVHLEKHFVLTEIKPLFGFTKKDLCVIKSAEKNFQLKILDKLALRSGKERQQTYEKYPTNQKLIYIFVRRQELLNKLYLDIESAFPVSDLNKCKKAYAEKKQELEQQNN
ncbi:MAG: hypothetical protein ABL930_06305 [Pseudobdellovibrio sp.]